MRLSFHANDSTHAFVKWIKTGILKAHYTIHILEQLNAFERARKFAFHKKNRNNEKLEYIENSLCNRMKGLFRHRALKKRPHKIGTISFQMNTKKCPIYCLCVWACVPIRNQRDTNRISIVLPSTEMACIKHEV